MDAHRQGREGNPSGRAARFRDLSLQEIEFRRRKEFRGNGRG